MATFTSVPQNSLSQFRHYNPTLLKSTQSKPKAKKTGQNARRNHGEVATQSSGLPLQESESNLPTVPQQTLQVQATGHVEDVEGMNLEKCDRFGADYRIGNHEFAMGDSHYQLRHKLCDEGVMDHATLDLTLNESFHGGGRDFNSITESDATGNHHNGSPNSQDKSQYLTTANGRDHTKQRGDLYTAVEYALPIEDVERTYHEGPLVENETFSGIASVGNGSSKNQKRSHQSSVVDGTITTLEAMPNVVPVLELDDPHPSKRQRMAERQAPSSMIESTHMPEPTPLLHPDNHAFHLSTNEGSFPSPLGIVHEEDCIISAALSLTDLYDLEHRDGAYVQRVAEEPLQAQGTMTLPEGLELEEDIGQEPSRGGVNRQGSGSKTGEISGEKPSRNDSCSIPSSISQRHRRRDWTPETGRGPSNTAPRTLDYNATPPKPPQQVKVSQSQQSSISERLDIDKGSQTRFSESNSLGTTAKDGTNMDLESGSGMSCQITDLTLCTIPNDSSVVFATLRYDNPNRSLDLVALSHNVFGERGKVIRLTQLSSNSWVLVGYQCNGSAADLCNRGSLNKNWMSSAYNDTASHGTDRSNDGYDEEDENGEEDTRGHSQRTHKRWLKSEEVRLLSLKDKQGMEWGEVCERFPSRSPGAVKLRYYALKKRS